MFSSLPCEQGEAWIILDSDMQRRKLPGDHKQSPRKPIRAEYFPYSRPWLVGCSIPAAKPRAGPERVPVDQSRSHRMRVGPVLPTGLHTLVQCFTEMHIMHARSWLGNLGFSAPLLGQAACNQSNHHETG